VAVRLGTYHRPRVRLTGKTKLVPRGTNGAFGVVIATGR
jgi:hypothetical protein